MNKKERMSGKTKSKIRHILSERYGWKCYYCGANLIPDENWDDFSYNEKRGFYFPQLDHKIPVSRGGTSKIENLVLSCRICNRKKGNMTDSEFIKKYISPEYIEAVTV